jgi:hypothetical protein
VAPHPTVPGSHSPSRRAVSLSPQTPLLLSFSIHLSTVTMATATTSAYHCNAVLHLPRPPQFRRLLPPLPSLVTRRAASVGLGVARLGSRARARASSVPPPPPFFETVEEEEEEEEERGWSDAEAGFSDEAEDEQEWSGGNGAARGEDLGADAGEDLSGWARQWPRPRELFVCNLPRRCDVQDLLELFTPHGTVLSVEVRYARARRRIILS